MAVQLLSEKREYPRLTSNRMVQIKEKSGQTKRLVAVNYSLFGMALRSSVALDVGDFIDMRFRLDDNNQKILDMTAEVVQYYKEGHAYVIGVKFTENLPLESSMDKRMLGF